MSSKTASNISILDQLIHDFYEGNLNFCLQPEDFRDMNWEWQQAFLDATVNSDLLKKYPISGKFVSLFLKKIINYLESNQEVHDDFYTYLCTAMNYSNKDEFSYRHYLIGNDRNSIISTKETKNIVVNGTTGLKTWEAALMLSDWALCNKDLFFHKNILELGSGVGFTGITIAKHCGIKNMIFTDCHKDVLKTISENIHINFPYLEQTQANDITLFKGQDKNLSVMMLDWNAAEDIPYNIVPDILIGADIVYDPSILQPLCNVIQTFCTRNNNLKVYIASVIRNEQTFNSFLKDLGDLKFEYVKMELEKSVFIKWDESISKCMLEIKKINK